MISLKEYCFDHLIYENTSNFKLLKTFEDAKEWFKSVGYIDNDDNDEILRSKMLISLNDILTIYDIADENNKIAPLIGNYKSKNVFTMRRWIDNYIDIWRDRTGNNFITDDWFWTPIRGIYAGPHNTKLKEDGSFNPTAEDMESVISFAYNHLTNPTYDDYENINYVCNISKSKPNQKVENLLNYYQDEKKFMDNIANTLIKSIYNKNLKFHKLLSGDSKATKHWEELGTYKELDAKINNTPKTDIISSDNHFKISLKKANGSQLMSGAFCEAKATIMGAAENTLDEDTITLLQSKLDIANKWVTGINKQKTQGSDEIKKLIYQSENSASELTQMLNKLLDENKEFKKALLYEAMTGEIKFGKNSLSSANYVFVWSAKESENKLYKVNDYLDHILSNKLKIEVAWKTGGSKSYQVLRITTK